MAASAEVLLYRLKVYYEYLIEDLEAGQVIHALYSRDCLNRDDKDEVLAEKTRRNKAHVLLDKIERRGGKAVQTLINALKRSSQPHLADMLNNPVANEEQEAFKHIKHISENLSQVTISEPSNKGRYAMDRTPSGIAVIINNYDFEEKTLLKMRDGSTKDVCLLTELFKKLQFERRYYNNLNLIKMKDVVRKYSLEDHSDYDCFIMVFMSHGVEGGIYGTDGGVLHIHKDVAMSFAASKCVTLKEKPKLFFIQACRGKEFDRAIARDCPAEFPLGYEEITPSVHADGQSVANMRQSVANPPQNPNFPPTIPLNPSRLTGYPSTGDSFTQQRSSNSEDVTPDFADIFISFASSTSKASGRNTIHGSFYITKLVDVFMKNAHKDSLMTMLQEVNAEVRKKRIPAGIGPDGETKYHVQVPQLMANMSGDVFFKPLK